MLNQGVLLRAPLVPRWQVPEGRFRKAGRRFDLYNRTYYGIAPLAVWLLVAVPAFQMPGITLPTLDFPFFRDLSIAFIMFVSAGLGFPFPEEILIVGAGIWTAAHPEYGVFGYLMLPVCIAGVLISDGMLYGIGRLFGPRLLKRAWVQKMLPPEKLVRIEHNYQHYGVSILLFGRLVPGIRLPLFLTAGIMRLSVPRFILADGLGAVLGNTLLFFLGYWGGDSVMYYVKTTEEKVVNSRPLMVIIGVVAVSAFLLYRFLRRPVPEGDIKKEVPIIGPQIAARIESADATNQNKPESAEKAAPPAEADKPAEAVQAGITAGNGEIVKSEEPAAKAQP